MMMRIVILMATVVLLTLVVAAAHAVCPSVTDFSSNPPQKVTDASGADYFPSDLNTTHQPSFCSGHGASRPCAAHRVYKPAPGASVYPQLLLFLPGSGMEPDKHDLVLRMGAYAGYHTIGLSYDTRFDPGARDLCPAQRDCAACYGPAREEIITGEPTSLHVTIQKGDSVIRRLFQLLQKLHQDDMVDGRNDDHWDSHLDPSNTVMPIVWRNIIVAGFSQGAGHAAYISQLFGARGLVMLDGGYDTCGNDVLADWYKPVGAAIPKYFVGHCRPPDIPCPQSTATPLPLKRLGFPDTLYVLESANPPTTPTPSVTMTTQAVVDKDPSGTDSFPPGKHCNDHFSMARDGCMPTSAQSEAAATAVPQVYLFEPYLARFCKACYGPDCPSPRPLELLLVGGPRPTELSGKASVPVTLGVTVTEDDPNAHAALYGISSHERGDDPCQVTLKIEDLMTYFDRPDVSIQKCGTDKDPTSSTLYVVYDDRWGTRAFMTGIQVCMDRQDDKVKGFQIFGQVIDNNGDLFPLPPIPKQRTNCHHWAKTVASCPADHLATAAELHFEREDNEKHARSLTGVRLHCRRLYKQGFGTLP
jgi:hypothetical protein